MTQPQPGTIEREKEKLFVTDAELIRKLGVPERTARRAISMLDAHHRETGFPQKQKLWGDRRYWPAVLKFLDATCLAQQVQRKPTRQD